VEEKDRDIVILESEKTFYCEINFECHMTFNFGTEGVQNFKIINLTHMISI
jgi:hypothetical protein